jgi:hypothetical protein
MQSHFLQINDFSHFRTFGVRRIRHPRKNLCRPTLTFLKERNHVVFGRQLRRHGGRSSLR